MDKDPLFAALSFNPIPALLDWENVALTYFTRRDLLGESVDPIETLWQLPTAVKLIAKQQDDGSWKYPGKTIDPEAGTNYFLIETYRTLRVLVENYGFSRSHPALELAAEYIFSCQSTEGDIRGILGNQYIPYYHGAILELLIKAGFTDDERVKQGLDWLLSVQQYDGGWLIPAQTVPAKEKKGVFWRGAPLPAERSLPHAHMATGMAIRAFAVHPAYRQNTSVQAAGVALKSRFLKADKYHDRKAKAYWLKFQFPFWWTSLLTALDSLAKIGFDPADADIAKGIAWFIHNQAADGLWPTGYGTGVKAEPNRRWVGLSICRMLSQFEQGK